MKLPILPKCRVLAMILAALVVTAVTVDVQAKVIRQSTRIGGDSEGLGGYKFESPLKTGVPSADELNTNNNLWIPSAGIKAEERIVIRYVWVAQYFAALLR